MKRNKPLTGPFFLLADRNEVSAGRSRLLFVTMIFHNRGESGVEVWTGAITWGKLGKLGRVQERVGIWNCTVVGKR